MRAALGLFMLVGWLVGSFAFVGLVFFGLSRIPIVLVVAAAAFVAGTMWRGVTRAPRGHAAQSYGRPAPRQDGTR